MKDGANSGTAERRSTKLFFSGVLVLTIANIANKILGVFMKIPLENIVGAEGMGYFSQAYTVYTCLFMISTTGLPTAVSLLISESRARGSVRESKRICSVTLWLFTAIGLLGTVIMMAGSGVFSRMSQSPNAQMSIIFLGPTMFFICVSSALRGYFQGYQVMVPTAVSELIESVMKVAVGVILAIWAIDQGYEIKYVAAFAILGVTIGVAFGALYLVLAKFFFREQKYDEEYAINKNDLVSPRGHILKRLITVAVPITISASMLSVAEAIDLPIMMDGLMAIGHNEATANALYGNWCFCVRPLFDLPPALVYPISYSLLPLIKATLTEGDHTRAETFMHMSLRISTIMAMPCALGLSVMAEPIIRMLYGAEDAAAGAPLLTIVAPAIIFVCLLSVTNALLQAYGHERKPIISMIAGACVKIALTYILVRIPQIGVYGVPISTFFCYFTASVCNVYFLVRHVGVKLEIGKMMLKPLASGVICALSAYAVYYGLSFVTHYIIAMFAGIAVAAIVYIVLIFALGAISEQDIMLIPKGARLVSLWRRVGAKFGIKKTEI